MDNKTYRDLVNSVFYDIKNDIVWIENVIGDMLVDGEIDDKAHDRIYNVLVQIKDKLY